LKEYLNLHTVERTKQQGQTNTVSKKATKRQEVNKDSGIRQIYPDDIVLFPGGLERLYMLYSPSFGPAGDDS
jgi:hypothetical protein